MVKNGMSKYIASEYLENLVDYYLGHSNGAEHYAFGVMRGEIRIAPAADVELVRHGHWIEEYVYAASPYDRIRYKCSLCGKTEEWKEPYCHCGAKMD